MNRHMLLISFCFLLLSNPAFAEEPAGWFQRGGNARRTGQSSVNGVLTTKNSWEYTANDGVVINIEATVTNDSVYFGTWGITRRLGFQKTQWDKFDGKIYGLNLKNGRELWPPLHPSFTPYAYHFADREPTEQDKPAGKGMHWNYSNGTVEGTGCFDPETGLMYVGRGDGKLFAVNPKTGKLGWTFKTYDPARKTDPESGGEVVGGPVVSPVGVILFNTFAAPHRPNPPKLIRHETNAVYGISRRGKFLWRYPATGTLASPFVASLALSVDGKTVYGITGLPHKEFPCELLALDAASGRLNWRMDLGQDGGQDLAVGIDGTIYVSGMRESRLGAVPIAFAVEDRKSSGRFLWGPLLLDGIRPKSHFTGGIALFESGNRVESVYVSTTLTRNLNGVGGKLFRLNPRTGKTESTWDPEEATPKCIGGLSDVTLDQSGTIYVGVRGRWKTLLTPEVHGRMYALKSVGNSFQVIWSYEVDGQIDWASPAIGPHGGVYFGSSSNFPPIGMAFPRGAKEDIKDADPKFYGIIQP